MTEKKACSHLVYYGALATLVVVGLVDWPVALIVGAGHVLVMNSRSETLRELGEALEEA